jgi:hypothetical protein
LLFRGVMLPRTGTMLVGAAFLASGVSACGGGYTGTCGAAARVPLAPAGVYVDDDVADGYVAYAGALAAAGTWAGDATYGVHWCPAAAAAGDGFRPYVSRGHWATSEQPVHGAPPGTPYWASDGAAPWADVTTHHGYWIDLANHFSGRSEWCWVPGAQETPARVVWREGDGFVGWAPEPPVWVDDGDENVAVGFEWSFELLGTLLEDASEIADCVNGYLLAGDAAEAAADATSPSRHSSRRGPSFSRHAPAQPVVAAARNELAARVRARPAFMQATAGASASAHAPSSSSSSSSSSSPSHKKTETTDERLPPAGVLVRVVAIDDPGLVPLGILRFPPSLATTTAGSEPTFAGSSQGAAGGSAGRGTSAHGSPTWTASSRSGVSSSSYSSSHSAVGSAHAGISSSGSSGSSSSSGSSGSHGSSSGSSHSSSSSSSSSSHKTK